MGLIFTHASYQTLLSRLLDAGYTSASFEESDQLLAKGDPFVLLRHDIDFSLTSALEMAHIEAEMGLFSTWFVLVRTEHYNPFSADGSRAIEEILGMGHRLGLHFDCAAYPNATMAEMNAGCNREACMLEDWFAVDVPIVSIHRPAPWVVGSDHALTAPRWHTYMPRFSNHIHYLADSRGTWRYGEPLDSPAFHAGRPLHLLVHPIWWRATETTPSQTLTGFVEQRSREIERSMAENSTVYRPNEHQRVEHPPAEQQPTER